MYLFCCEEEMRLCMVKCLVNYKAQCPYAILLLGAFCLGMFLTDSLISCSNKNEVDNEHFLLLNVFPLCAVQLAAY